MKKLLAVLAVISAFTLIGCSQATGSGNGHGTSQSAGLEGSVFRWPDRRETFLYFSGGTVYGVARDRGEWIKQNIVEVTYTGNTIYTNGKPSTVTVTQDGLTMDGYFFKRETDQSIINTVKNATLI